MSGQKKILRAIFCAAALVAAPGVLWADGAPSCPSEDWMKPRFSPDLPVSLCATTPPAECANFLNKVLLQSKNLHTAYAEMCSSIGNFQKQLSERTNLGQRDSANSAAELWGQQKSEYGKLYNAMSAAYNDILAAERAQPGPLALKPANLIPSATYEKNGRAKLTSQLHLQPTNFKEETITGLPSQDVGFSAGIYGAQFLQQILKEQAQIKIYLDTASNNQNKSQIIANNSKNPDANTTNAPNTVVKTEDSGMDLKTLAGLATAAGALAPFLAKKSDSTISTDTAAATSPTPSSAGAGPSAPTVDNLGGASSKSSAVNTSTATSLATALPASLPVGSSSAPVSDISSHPATGASATPATAKATGAGGGSAAAAAPGAAATAAPLAADKKEEDAMQGIGSGGLGGGIPPANFPPSSPGAADSAAPTAAAEDSMKALLNDMKGVANGGDSASALSDASNELAMEAGDLFPRVRACYSRLLKQGRVFNGFGDRINP